MSTSTNVSGGGEGSSQSLAVIFVNVFTSPREAFAALAARPVVLWPLLAIILANALLVFWYYVEVDFAWFIETSMRAAGQEPPPELAGAGAMGDTARIVTGVLAATATALILLVLMLLTGGYLSFVSMFTNDRIPFKQWLSLAAWASLPTLLDVAAGAVNMAVNDFTYRLPTEIFVFSFGALLGIDPAATGFLSNIAHQASVTSIWALALIVLGYKMWTGKPMGKAFLIVAAPLLVIVGIGLVLAAL